MRLIDADALHERIAHACNRRRMTPGGVDDLFADGLEFAEDMLLEAPTAGAVGKWLNSNGDYSQVVCSACGYRIETTHEDAGSKTVFDVAKRTLRYCPHCGAQMEEHP